MIFMKKFARPLICLFSIIGCCAVLPAAAYAGDTETPPSISGETLPVSEPLLIYGKLHRDGDRLMITGVHGAAVADTVVLNTSEETRILNAQSGMPVDKASLQEGEMIYAYVSQAMTLSLPPQSSASLILCQLPADNNVPSFETVAKMTKQEDATFLLTTVRGNHYLIDNSTSFLPYLTRNIVTVNDLLKDSTCLIWTAPRDGQNDTEVREAQRVMIFPSQQLKQPSGPASDPWLNDDLSH